MIIGLSGWARAGKDTVGKILVEQYGFERMAFAEGVYAAAEALDPIVGVPFGNSRLSDALRYYNGWHDAKDHPEIRRLLQRIGTEVGREVIDPDVWVMALANRLEWTSLGLAVSPDRNYVITDVRFFNEANWVKKVGGRVVRIRRGDMGPANDHVSERQLDGYPHDARIDNNGSIEGLVSEVQTLMERFGVRSL